MTYHDPYLDMADTLLEVDGFFHYLVLYHYNDSDEEYNMTPGDTWACLLDKFWVTWPNLILLGCILLVQPLSAVKCERGFSGMSRVKSKLRNCLDTDHLRDLMRIQGCKCDVESYDFKGAYKFWSSHCPRLYD